MEITIPTNALLKTRSSYYKNQNVSIAKNKAIQPDTAHNKKNVISVENHNIWPVIALLMRQPISKKYAIIAIKKDILQRNVLSQKNAFFVIKLVMK